MLPKSTIEYGMCATISQSSRPMSNDLLRMWPVSKRVNVSRRGSDDPSLIEPVEIELPLLKTANQEANRAAYLALKALGSSIGAYSGDNPVVIANPAGVAYIGIVELPGQVPAEIQGVQFDTGQNNIAQQTYEGGLVFLASVQSLGYRTGYLTNSQGTISSEATIVPQESSQTSYTLQNEHLTVVINADSNWGIGSIHDAQGNSLLSGIGNDLVFYEDGGDIYEFGNEYVVDPLTFQSQPVGFAVSGPGLGATVLEQGPVRVRVRATVEVQGVPSTQFYTREYTLVAGEPFLRMTTTGAAGSGYSIMAAFPLSQPVDTITHGTPCHWTGVQPNQAWDPPVFRATHKFMRPQSGPTVLAAVYHRDVPAWGFTGENDVVLKPGVLIGCLLRNTPGVNRWGAIGTDDATHTLQYAFRIAYGLGDPATGQPLSEALNYTQPPLAAMISQVVSNSETSLPESGFLASIDSPGVILAAKPGDVEAGTLVLRLYQPTNSPQTLSVTLGAGAPSQATAITALEDPATDNDAPSISINGNVVTLDVKTALNTIAIRGSDGTSYR